MDNKVLIIEYYEEDARRQSQAFYYEDEAGDWAWRCPESFDESQKEEWHRIVGLLSNVEGMDLRAIICGVGLKDHCLGSTDWNYLDEIPEEQSEESEESAE